MAARRAALLAMALTLVLVAPCPGAEQLSLLDRYRFAARDAANFMHLDAAGAQRLYGLLAAVETANPVVTAPGTLSRYQEALGNSSLADPFVAAIDRQFGAAAAARWTLFRQIRYGLQDNDRLLRSFYDAEVPLTGEQREQYARTQLEVNAAMAQEYKAAGPVNDNAALEALANEERQLALAERRTALIVSQARRYLNVAQTEVLFARLDERAAGQRKSLQIMRENIAAGRSPNAGLGPDESRPLPGVPQPTAEQLAAGRRRAFMSNCVGRVSQHAAFLRLAESSVQHLCEVIAEPHMNVSQAGGTLPRPMGYFTPGISREIVTREFGAGFAARWTQYENMDEGLAHVDGELARFYDGGSPLSNAQRVRLATTYQQFRRAEQREPFRPTDLSPGAMTKYMAELQQRQLPIRETSNAAIVAEASSYLDQRQIDILSEMFAEEVRQQRQATRSMLGNSAREPGGVP